MNQGITVWLLKGLGMFCCNCGPFGQPDQLRRQGQQLGPRRLAQGVGEKEKIVEVHHSAAIQVEARIGSAEGVGEKEEVVEIHHLVTVEVRRSLGDGAEGHRIQIGRRYLDGVGARDTPQREHGRRTAAVNPSWHSAPKAFHLRR